MGLLAAQLLTIHGMKEIIMSSDVIHEAVHVIGEGLQAGYRKLQMHRPGGQAPKG